MKVLIGVGGLLLMYLAATGRLSAVWQALTSAPPASTASGLTGGIKGSRRPLVRPRS